MKDRRILVATILCFRFDGAEELIGKGSIPIVSLGNLSFVLASSGAGNAGFSGGLPSLSGTGDDFGLLDYSFKGESVWTD